MSAVPTSLTPRLRPMLETDVAGVMAVERTVYPFPWTAGIFRDCLRVGYCCYVWEQGAEIHGYGVMSAGGGEAHILNLAVRSESQGQGLGRRMLEHLIDIASRYGVDAVFLEVRPSNKRAVALYHHVGFEQVGVRHNYYPDQQGREDALIMARQLRM